MGLFDSGSLSSPDAQIMLAAGLLGGRGNFGANLGQGLLGAVATQQQERANRANDMQQLVGAYNLVKQQEGLRMLQAKRSGTPYQPNPMLAQMESRLNQLLGNPNLSSQGPTGSMLPGQGGGAPMPSPAIPQGAPSPAPLLSMPSQGNPAPMPSMPPQANAAPMPSMPQQGAFGNSAFGVEPEEFMAMANAPGGKEYLDALIKQQTPITTRFGVYGIDPSNPGQVKLMGGMIPRDALPIQFGPDGKPNVQALPGQVKTQSDLAEASARGAEAGKFPGRVETVTLADGRVVPQLLSNVVGNPYGGAPASASGLPFVTPRSAPQKQPSVATVTVTDPGKSQAAPAAPQLANDPWASLPKVQVAQGLGQSTTQRQLDTLRAEKMKALSDQYGSEADVAAQKLAQNNQALKLVENADTGAFATHISQFRNVLASLGISSAADKAATDQELAKDLVTAAIAKGKTAFTSRFTQGEVNLMLQRGSPSPEMQKEAIKYLLQTDNAQQKYNLQRGMDFGKAMSSNGDPLLFSQWYGTNFPMNLDSEHPQTITPTARRVYNSKTGKIE